MVRALGSSEMSGNDSQSQNSTAEFRSGQENYYQLPVVKLFTPDTDCTWLLSELDPTDPDLAFGLCDLSLGTPELSSVRLSELQAEPAAKTV